MLEMKSQCESCQAATGPTDIAYICSYECTFCKDCTSTKAFTCPNCGGELVPRPTREPKPSDVVKASL
ncbi:DUF1272 domain-containing protein [Thalassotalea litorea]|uniref:DUF1272 domain-containing protein n=1 Tax=Thalassotalea litorea TaxID=2020715 RepID=A0A5R9IKH7_9GAMM|nr:DUF1272 domain-containing protein [Thalassotalea litorea]TLU61797.1 DUF1272 domain-containing protein [Thalassotalea litorea]